MEEFRNIEGYDGLYQVSNYGNVKSLNYHCTGREKLLRPVDSGYGYLCVNLCKGGKAKIKEIHRLVAETFLPNPLRLPQVNHKDECKTNNCVYNLEWCTQEYNINHGTRNQRSAESRSKQVYQYNLDGELVKIWPSVNECERNGFYHQAVSACCNGKLKNYKGYEWSYKPL